MQLNNHMLQYKFKEFNRLYFGKSLDPETVVRFKKMKYMGLTNFMWRTRPATAKERRENNLNKTALACGYVPRIYLSVRFRHVPRICAQTLLHEMAHIATRGRKGDCNSGRWNTFNRRMLKLAKQGAFNGWW